MVKLVKRDGIAMPLLADGKGVSIRKSIFCIMVLLMEDHDESDALLYCTKQKMCLQNYRTLSLGIRRSRCLKS